MAKTSSGSLDSFVDVTHEEEEYYIKALFFLSKFNPSADLKQHSIT